ncbi:MAG: TonB-dependent receptor [Chitinophagaceae bacterium]|nr:TonB-dependent receptor [Chitinophagaceae bacterium]
MKNLASLILLIFVSTNLFSQSKPIETDSVKRQKIKTVIIKNRTTGSDINSLNPVRVERLGKTELSKNACCNLAESFESNPTVDVSVSDAVSGAKQIQLLGLSGTYVQTTTDLLPNVRGLNYTYGFNNIPSTFVDAIYITKGPGSVTNGFESMTGHIEIALQNPETYKSKLHVNGYINSILRNELNLNFAQKINSNWNTIFMGHGSGMRTEIDNNKDNFMDVPKYQQFQFSNRWAYSSDKLESKFGINMLRDKKIGGEILPSKIWAINPAEFQINISSQRINAFAKTSYSFDRDKGKSIGLQLNFSNDDINSNYGLYRNYKGNQKTLFANLIYQTILFNTQHLIKIGGGSQTDIVEEQFMQLNNDRNEIVSGIFTEYTYLGSDKFSLMAGARADYNNRINKTYFIPRLNIKYDLTDDFSIRGSAGSGMRTANIFADNTRLFASSRNVLILDKLMPEYSWNYGINFSYCYLQNKKPGRVSVDIFKTDFQNQVIADYDYSPQQVLFYNLNGRSNSFYVQAEWYYEIFHDVDIRLAYKFNDVRFTQRGETVERTFNPQSRALFNIAYKTHNEKWVFDFTTQWVGKQRLPNTDANPEKFRNESNFAPSYFRLLGQVTYKMPTWEIYFGSENISNFTQKKLIVSPENPYSPYFDAGNIWGPTMGRVFYLGARYDLKRNNNNE